MKHVTFFLFLNICLIITLSGQEILTGLDVNPVVSKASEMLKQNSKEVKSAEIKLPFIDDFSSTYVFPSSENWLDNDVFINDGYCINPLSLGCATFDALDENGILHDGASSFYFRSDYLTSQTIRLDSIFGSSPRLATPADSVYLSFFYQPQGSGERPDTDDSLVVEFFNPVSNTWNAVWKAAGQSFQQFRNQYGVDFKVVMLPIVNQEYFSDKFSFRFYNIASLPNNDFPTWAGNVDHWNIDYVYLNADRNINDTLPVDVAFRQRKSTLLKNYYSMPWSHFQVNPSAEMISEIDFPYSNYSNVLINLTEQFTIKDLSGTSSPYNSGISAVNVESNSENHFYRSPFPYTYNSGVSKNAEFEVKFFINSATISDLARTNDTMFFYQRFYNYFAQDDGTPETGYALTGKNAQLAYMFHLSHQDTLQAVQFQFNRVLNQANEDLYFTLKVWNDNGGKPGEVIYQKDGLRPIPDGLYGFTTYEMEQPLLVSGNVYIGWYQQDEAALNIGFDRNTDKSSRIFYNVDGNWYNSMFSGALMMRAIVGSQKTPYVEVEENLVSPRKFNVYPNPICNGEVLQIQGLLGNESVKIYSIDGREVLQARGNNKLIINNLVSGIYIMFIYNEKGAMIYCQKISVKE